MVALNRISTRSITNDTDERFLRDDHQESDISISIRLEGPKMLSSLSDVKGLQLLTDHAT